MKITLYKSRAYSIQDGRVLMLSGMKILKLAYLAGAITDFLVFLLWAYQRPTERRFVAPLTIIVIIGIAATNIIMLNRNTFTITELLPTFIIQTILIILFGYGYMNTRPEK